MDSVFIKWYSDPLRSPKPNYIYVCGPIRMFWSGWFNFWPKFFRVLPKIQGNPFLTCETLTPSDPKKTELEPAFIWTRSKRGGNFRKLFLNWQLSEHAALINQKIARYFCMVFFIFFTQFLYIHHVHVGIFSTQRWPAFKSHTNRTNHSSFLLMLVQQRRCFRLNSESWLQY